MPRDTSKPRESNRDYIKERTHSTSSSSSRRDKTRESFVTSTTGSKSRHSSDREKSVETTSESSIKKSRLKPPPVVLSTHRSSTKITDEPDSPTSSTSLTGDVEPNEEYPPCVLDKFDLFACANKFDEEESKTLDVPEALQVYLDQCNELEHLIIEAYERRKNSKSQSETVELVGTQDFMDVEDQSAFTMVTVRRINRLLKLRLKLTREEILEQRQTVDKAHLELQNLLYEAIHLNKQVVAGNDCKSMDEKIDLIPLDQFYKEAPVTITKPHLTQKDSHLLRIARLEYEFIQRKELAQQCSNLEKTKNEISEEIAKQKKRLDGVKPILNNILAALRPAQEFFDPEFGARQQMFKAAEYLPPPLYVLYVSSIGYQEYLGEPLFKIDVKGDVAAAKEIVKSPDELILEDSDSDMDVDEPFETEILSRRSLKKHVSFVEEREDHEKKIVEAHPLYLEWTITGESFETLTVSFHYVSKLRIVTVQTSISTNEILEKVKDLILGNANSVLEEIYKGDTGTESPNPSTSFYLKSLGVESLSKFIPVIGHPYRWAQELAGLRFPIGKTSLNEFENYTEKESNAETEYDFLPNRDIAPDRKLSIAKMDTTFKLIQKRLKSQTYLWKQLKNLETRTLHIPPELQSEFPVKNSTLFASWEAIDWETYKSHSSSIFPLTVGLVNSKSMFFKATLERGRVRVVAVVVLSLNYPEQPPIFSVQLDEDGNGQSTIDFCIFREIERELNVFAVKEFNNFAPIILSLQLQRLLYCIDISLETMSDNDSVGPSEFAREKLFENRVKGKSFRRPFKYVGRLGGHFMQRF